MKIFLMISTGNRFLSLITTLSLSVSPIIFCPLHLLSHCNIDCMQGFLTSSNEEHLQILFGEKIIQTVTIKPAAKYHHLAMR